MNLQRLLPLAFGGLLAAALPLRAQYELKAGNFNGLFVPQTAVGAPATPSGPPNVTNPLFPTAGQFSAMGQVSGSSGPVSSSGVFADRYPSTPDNAIVLVSSTIGRVFASGVPRYNFGDVITPPLVQADNSTPAADGYWRAKPVLPGETFTLVSGSSFGTSLASVTVTSATTTSPDITVASVPPDLVVGATVLGQPVTKITGTTVTLAGPPSASISANLAVPITPALPFYYSPHAEKVFASQAGRVSITWVTRVADAQNRFAIKTEDFAVSNTSTLPTRTIFWTEAGFDGPRVQITDSRITTVNPIFYSLVPKAVPEEVQLPGYVPLTPNLTTLSFSKFNGNGQLSAYNVEGRVLVEYLGNLRVGQTIYEHIGTDVVDIRRVPPVYFTQCHLGKEIAPHDNDSTLRPSPVDHTQSASTFYGTSVRSDGQSVYTAEKDTSLENKPDNGEPASPDGYNKVAFYWMAPGSFGIQWPKFQDRYWLRWSPNLDDYSHYTVDAGGSTAATGITFTGGSLPQLVWQDDPNQKEAVLDLTSQRLLVNPGPDQRNRALLKFSNSGVLWYINLYTQPDSRHPTPTVDANGTTTVTLVGKDADGKEFDTTGLEVGMVVTGTGLPGTVRVVSILDRTRLVLSEAVSKDGPYRFTVESDLAAPIHATATVGTRIAPPAGHEFAGYISEGTGYYPAGYLNPFVVGAPAANQGAIIPVNAIPGHDVLVVRWFKRIPADKKEFQDLYVPGKIGRYTVSFPSATQPSIVIAAGVGSGDLPPQEAAGAIYVQNNPALPGYNPNEEHALLLGGRAYALRDDLNVTTGAGFTSKPCVLVAHTDPADQRPAMRAYLVQRVLDQNGNGVKDAGDIFFDYTATAGTLLVKPYPLPLLPEPLVGTGVNRRSMDKEVLQSDPPANAQVTNDTAYRGFTFQDRKGFTWVHRGPHAQGSPTLTMKLYYPSRPGFFIPGIGEPAPGTVLPFLRRAVRTGLALDLGSINDGAPDEPLTVVYRPVWPADAPELLVGETLTLPKYGLPQIRGQTSVQVLYQQSIATNTTASTIKSSVVLHDPTREKTVALDAPGIGLTAIPPAIKTANLRGKTYFQRLPPHLIERFYLDPLRGQRGTLVLVGEFHDVIAGDDYLDLNLLSSTDEAALKDLVPTGDANKAKWDLAIDALATRVETFMPNPAQFGSFKVDPTRTVDVGENDPALISSSETAVDSYALTANGRGSGYVTLVMGNGEAFTPEGDPVVLQVLKVARQLYVGDLKVLYSDNPLDEQVTLRHSADYAGHPEDYEFEWRWATGAASAPATYTYSMVTRVGAPGTSDRWRVVRDPGALRASPAQLASAGAPSAFPRAENVRPASHTEAERAAGFPALWLNSATGADFSNNPAGVPGNIVFSATLGDLDGFVLYVNGKAALAHNAPDTVYPSTSASSGLTPGGLERQFNVAPGSFHTGSNKVEVAVYSDADPETVSSLNFRLEAALETDQVTTGTVWQTPSDPNKQNTNFAQVGGSPTTPFGGPQFVLNDRWFTMRYRPKPGTGNVLGTPWSRWMPPQFVEGWVKRVLAGINPFEQRVKDLFNNQINTDVSVITQAGTRWEGDIALNLDNVNSAGLIEIYETVLNRAKSMSIDANTNDPDTNNALLLAAGYLNDLYTLLGNEAYADAANPTISIDDQGSVAEVNTSRFSFEGQVASSLDEELALLRGRDDTVSPGVNIAPAYNRLYWNFTRGINGGEAIYAVNYNIHEKVGGETSDGVVDEADAQRMFPQGHGDAYGHYLTALTGYYRLLTNPNFTWTPRAEAVTVLGQPVTVDFQDERKFAAAAGNVARAAQQIVGLTHRQAYRDDPADGWSHLRDQRTANASTGITPRQGLEEWVSRSTQGAFYHWAVANQMLPAQDTVHTGVQKIDRTTVPEIAELAAAAAGFQTTLDNANAHLNPLGLSPSAIAFDIDPNRLDSGNGDSHYEQVAERALTALSNASGAFTQAAMMTRSLRDQDNQIDDYNTGIAQQESAFIDQLIDIYGRPYSGDRGAGQLYAQDYEGPDLFHWFIVDRPDSLVDTAKPVVVTIQEAKEIGNFTGNAIQSVLNGFTANKGVVTKTVTIQPSRFVQYNDVWKATGLGTRPETGELQQALQDAQLSWLAISDANVRFARELADLRHFELLFRDLLSTHVSSLNTLTGAQAEIMRLERLVRDREIVADTFADLSSASVNYGEAVAEGFPMVIGFAADPSSLLRSGAKAIGYGLGAAFNVISLSTRASARVQQTNILDQEQRLEYALTSLGFQHEQVQFAYEYDTKYRELVTHANELMQLTLAHQSALQNVANVLAKGERILSEREVFRQRAASIIQGYRTQDITFRLFRNEALEQYRSLYDLASRYTYLAAKSYDYETGLLGSDQGRQVFSDIVASRSLGDLRDGVPQPTTSTLGDAGLAGTLARLNADFSVAEGRLGINNPDALGTAFSLRRELYRLLDDPAQTSDDTAWRQTLEQHTVPNLLTDPDVATFCRNLRRSNGAAVPGILVPFSTTITQGRNFFGLELAAGDHAFSPSSFSTKISSLGVVFKGYVGLDTLVNGGPVATNVVTQANGLSSTPYLYLIPCGTDYMQSPPLGDTALVRAWKVHDQALPLPYNLGATDFNATQFFNANGTLSEQPWILRKYQAFRAVGDQGFFHGSAPAEFTNRRLVARSVWNSQWKLVIPGYTLLNDEQEGLKRFAASVQDIELFLRTYSYSGN